MTRSSSRENWGEGYLSKVPGLSGDLSYWNKVWVKFWHLDAVSTYILVALYRISGCKSSEKSGGKRTCAWHVDRLIYTGMKSLQARSISWPWRHNMVSMTAKLRQNVLGALRCRYDPEGSWWATTGKWSTRTDRMIFPNGLNESRMPMLTQSTIGVSFQGLIPLLLVQ